MTALIVLATLGTILLTIDILKIALEVCWPKAERRFTSDPSKFTVIITAYNESEIIARTARLFANVFPRENIIVADDGSVDGTGEIAEQMVPGIRVFSFPHQGKNKTTEAALQYVSTPYVILADADVYPADNFRCPAALLEEATSCATKILPKLDYDEDRYFSVKNILLGLQYHEYAKSMNSKRFGSNWKSVYSISGALGFFRTERLKYLMPQQTEVFAGEDLERTLIDLSNEGETEYIDNLVETDVPQDISRLVRQRTLSWWPGLWRCFPLLWGLLWKKRSSAALRFEVFYQLLSMVNEPLKLISLYALFNSLNLLAISQLYLLYVFLEMFAGYRLGERRKLKNFFFTMILYPFYGFTQMILRIIGLPVFLFRRVSHTWPGIQLAKEATTLMLLLFSVHSVNAAEFSVTPGFGYVSDSNGRKYVSPTVWLQHEKAWLDGQQSVYDSRIDLGVSKKWIGVDWAPQIRIRNQEEAGFELKPKLVVEAALLGPMVGRLGAAYQLLGDLQGTTLHNAGLDIYYGDASFISVDTMKEIGNHEKSDLVILKNRYASGSWTTVFGGSINTRSNRGLLGWVSWKSLRVGFNWNENFEHYDFDRMVYSFSVNIPLK